MAAIDYLRYAPRIFWKRRTSPVYLVFFVTTRCNARCRHCLFGQSPPRRDDLDLDEIERIARSMDDVLFLLPTGGQPFLRPDLAEIVKIFYRHNHIRNCGIPTNGTQTERTLATVEEILRSCPDLDLGIDVSIDGIGAEHDAIRGVPGLFDTAIVTYRALRDLERRHERLNVNIETTVSAYNDDRLVALYRYLRDEVGVNTVFTLLTRGDPRDPHAKRFSIDRYIEYSELLEAENKRRVLSGYYNFPFADVINAERIVRHRLIARTVRDGRYQTPCYAGVLGAALMSNGEVWPCELRPDRALGNLRDVNYDFKRLWFSERADAARRDIRCSKCFCTYECFHTFNILFNPRMLLEVGREWASLKWVRLRHRLRGVRWKHPFRPLPRPCPELSR